ncbi:MAG TPA: carboxyltransferase domain-containing protein [Thermoanaerobaculia bacterium]|nr:carboxyltransferase domain-containing protein [Thermoanaerobaculia bacterium]
MKIVPAGDNALLGELGDITAEELHAMNARAAAIARSIPGHSSLYVFTPDRAALAAALTANRPPPTTNAILRIPVTFDGEDLHRIDLDLHRLHGLRLTARYLGFRGGFAYLDGWPEEWAMPRRPTSRPVKAGSFAVAGSVAAFYPIDSPGGWNILGHTTVRLEDRIRVGDVLEIAVTRRNEVQVDAPLSVWTGKPFDAIAATLANRAVGNDEHSEVLECPLVGPRVRFTKDAVAAWCTPDLDLHVEHVRAGEERAWGRIENGLRAYLAVGEREMSVDVPRREDRHVIRAMRGPHDIGIERIECEVTPQLDRIGIRLRPLQPLDAAPATLRSIGMQMGTVQLHPDGSLVAMGPEHPVTGGYLQPMTVLTAEQWKLAQLAPGERVTFVTVSS